MKNTNTKTLTRVALLVAIELVMKLVGLGSVPVGPLYMSFLTLPIAVGAITMGPAVGALLGGVFGAVSFYDAITGASAMTGALFQVSPLNTFILCVGMRVLMGLCCGLIFRGLKGFDKPGTWSYLVSAMSAPFLNTMFFMGYIVLAFYGCDYVQNLVSVKGAANPFMFVVLLVGVQGVAEFLVSGILGGISGILITSHLNSAKSSNGSTYTLLTLLIIVLGGVHPDGGKGKVMGVTLSVLLLQLIANAFTIMRAPDTFKTFVNGCLLVAALILDVVLEKRAAKKAAKS